MYTTHTRVLVDTFLNSPSLLEPVHILLADIDLSSSRDRRVARELLEEYFLDSTPEAIEALMNEFLDVDLIDWDDVLDWYQVNYVDQYDFQEHLDSVLAGI